MEREGKGEERVGLRESRGLEERRERRENKERESRGTEWRQSMGKRVKLSYVHFKGR